MSSNNSGQCGPGRSRGAGEIVRIDLGIAGIGERGG